MKPEIFFQVSSFQLLKLKHLHCDDHHIILSLSAVQIYDYLIYSYLIFRLTVLKYFKVVLADETFLWLAMKNPLCPIMK